MEEEQTALLNFINLHAKKSFIDPRQRQIFLTNYSQEGVALDVHLDILTYDDIICKYDMNDTLIRWVLKQMSSYDTASEVVIGLIFRNETILAHVLKLKPDSP